jgi:hypothetical protein
MDINWLVVKKLHEGGHDENGIEEVGQRSAVQ